MEIGISKKELLNRAFDKKEINGLYEIDSCLINSYEVLSAHFNYPVKFYLFLSKIRQKRLYYVLLEELEITDDILNKKIFNLSSGELVKVLILKACLSSCESVLLNHIDTCLSYGQLNSILKCLRRNLKDIDKTIIVSSNNIDNIVPTCTKYIILNNADVDYSGKNIEMLPHKTELMEFVDMANDRKAKMSYYKEPSDLLKAIYRSVKK